MTNNNGQECLCLVYIATWMFCNHAPWFGFPMHAPIHSCTQGQYCCACQVRGYSNHGCHFCRRGADLNALVREAAITALREHMQLSPLCQSPDQSDCVNVAETCIVSTRHFTTALRKIRPSVIEKVCVALLPIGCMVCEGTVDTKLLEHGGSPDPF